MATEKVNSDDPLEGNAAVEVKHPATSKRANRTAARLERGWVNQEEFSAAGYAFCDSFSQHFIDKLYPERLDLEVSRAIEINEWLLKARLFPERLGSCNEDIDREIEAMENALEQIFQARLEPIALAARRKAFNELLERTMTHDPNLTVDEVDIQYAFLDELDAHKEGIETHGSAAQASRKLGAPSTEMRPPRSPRSVGDIQINDDGEWNDVNAGNYDDAVWDEVIFGGPDCKIRRRLKQKLFHFLLLAQDFNLKNPHGLEILLGLFPSAIGKHSGARRSAPKKEYLNWVRQQRRTRRLPEADWKNMLVNEFLKIMKTAPIIFTKTGGTWKVTEKTLRKYLTPSNDFIED